MRLLVVIFELRAPAVMMTVNDNALSFCLSGNAQLIDIAIIGTGESGGCRPMIVRLVFGRSFS
jgi:hypothetical protein